MAIVKMKAVTIAAQISEFDTVVEKSQIQAIVKLVSLFPSDIRIS